MRLGAATRYMEAHPSVVRILGTSMILEIFIRYHSPRGELLDGEFIGETYRVAPLWWAYLTNPKAAL